MTGQNDKLLAVEGLRGIACFMVVLSHLSLIFYPYLHNFNAADSTGYDIQNLIHHSPFTFFFSGSAAVYIFFVLSGYILTKVALRSQPSLSRISSMAIKRYPRLMLPALISCLLAVTIFQFVGMPGSDMIHSINNYGDFDYSLTGALYNGTIDTFFLSGQSLYNPVLWTMKVELLGSFIIYFLCMNKASFNIPFLSIISLVILLALTGLKLIGTGLTAGLVAFYGGYYFCRYGRMIPLKIAIPLLLTGLYLAGAHNGSSSYALIESIVGQKTYILGNFLSGFFLVYAVIFSDRINGVFSGKLPVFMGKVSFSVYLIHLPLLSTLGFYLFELSFGYSNSYHLSALSASVLTVAVVYLGAVYFYKYVDLTGMKISNLFAKSVLGIFKPGVTATQAKETVVNNS
ncbi:acyltransferase [Thalassomonas sp. RHCl1]|uniref:acyltransferase family protein n=1 Tax=Thalassomonas sp. RHCl1 TaxID=2995320 RepID=UPI00248AB621|nr:acyltransferase [Thalassomonas sp. RHCl1]